MPETLITQIVDAGAYAQLDRLNKSLDATEKTAAAVVVRLTEVAAIFRDTKGIDALVTANKSYLKVTQEVDAVEKQLVIQRKAAETAAAKLAIAEGKIDDVMKRQAKSIAEAREQNKVLNQVRNNLVVTDEKSAKLLNEYNAKLDANNDYIKNNADAYLKQKINIGNYQSALSGLPGVLGKVAGGFQAAINGVKALTKAAMTFIATPVGAVIAALVAGLTLLKSGLSRTEEGQNKLAKASAVFGSVLQSIMDVVSKLADKIIGVFEDPIGSIKNLGQAIVDNIMNRIKGVIDLVQAAWKVLTNLGNAELRTEGVKEFGEAWLQVVTGVDDLPGKVKKGVEAFGGFVKGAIDAAAATAKLADRQAQLDKDNRAFLVEEQRLQREINELKEKSLNTELSVEERLAANSKAIELQNRLTARKAALAREEYDIIKETNALHDSTKEDLQKEAEAQAKYEQVYADGIQARRRLVTQQNTLEKEAISNAVSNDRAALDARIKAAQDAADARVQIAREEYENSNPPDRLAAYEALVEAETAAFEVAASSRVAVARAESAARVQTNRLAGDEIVAEEERLAAEVSAIEADIAAQRAAMQRQQGRERVKVAKEDADAALSQTLSGLEAEGAERKAALAEQLAAGTLAYRDYAKQVEDIEREMTRAALNAQVDMLAQQLDALELNADERLAVEKRYYAAKASLAEKDAEDEEEANEKRMEAAQAWLEVATDAFNALAELGDALFERKLAQLEEESAAIDARYDAEAKAAEDAGYSEELTQRMLMGIEEKRAAEQEELAKKEAETKKKQAIFDRGVAVMNVILSTSMAIMQAFAQTGPIAGAVFAGIVGALGAVQLATVLAAPLPQYAKGREGGPGEWAVVGDGGRSEVVEGMAGTYLTPAKPTLTYLQPGDIVHRSVGDYERRRGLDGEDLAAVVRAQDATTKAVKAWGGVTVRATSAGLTLLEKKGANGRRYVN